MEFQANAIARRFRTAIARFPTNTDSVLRRQVFCSRLFDATWYNAKYRGGVGGRDDALNHYLGRGWRQGHSPSALFDAPWYLSRYADVALNGVEPLEHFIKHGALEGRKINAHGDTLWTLADKIGEGARAAIIVANHLARIRRPIEVNAAERRAIVASGLFSLDWYRTEYPELDASEVRLDAYLERGWLDGRSPGPNFDLAWYVVHNPDIMSTGQHPLAHYVTRGRSEGRKCGLPSSLYPTIARLLASVGPLQPDIETKSQFRDIRFLRLSDGRTLGVVSLTLSALFNSLTKPYDRIVFVPWLIRGGADRVAINFITASEERYGPGSTLIITTDSERLEARDWLPASAVLRSISEIAPDLDFESRVQLVTALIQMLRPTSILIVNSRAAWESVARHGRALQHVCAIYATLFCRDFAPDGRPVGYADTHARDCLPQLTKVYFDNETFAAEFAARYDLPDSMRAKLTVLLQPAMEGRWASRYVDNPFRVLWAGRLCRQKNLDLLLAIARAAPDLRFEVYGEGEPDEMRKLVAGTEASDNLVYRGSFSTFETLPIESLNAYLYTSHWDGLPNALLAAARSGLPIVASAVGGVGELVSPETGWPIAADADPAHYAATLRRIREDPSDVARRTACMTQRLAERHSWAAFLAALEARPSFLR
jgi:glycosyltransferase involved in cell wall biosynthesis